MDINWNDVVMCGYTQYYEEAEAWYAKEVSEPEWDIRKVYKITEETPVGCYPSVKAVKDYIDDTIENVRKYTYSVENLGNKYTSGTTLKDLDITTTISEDVSTNQWYLACDIKVALAKYENGKIINLVNHPFDITYGEDGKLAIKNIDNVIETAVMIGSPKLINTYSSIKEEIVDGSNFTQAAKYSIPIWSGEAYEKQAIGIQLRLNIFSPAKAAIEGLKAEFDGIIAKTTHAIIYYHHNPFIIGG
jgi:hypothetical protein